MQRFFWTTTFLVFFAAACHTSGTQKTITSTIDEPRSSTDYYNRGVERQNKGDINAALADYTKAIEIDSRNFSAFNNRGNIKQDKGDLKGAIIDYTTAATINPRHATAHFNLGHAYQSRKDYPGAIHEYGKAIDVKPDYAMAYANRGLCQLYDGSDDEAQKDFDRSIEIDGNLKGALGGYIAKVKQERLASR